MMVVALKHVGTTAWLSEMLKMSVKTSVSSTAQSLSTRPGMLSGPGALRALILLRDLLTLSGDSVITWSPGGGGVFCAVVLFCASKRAKKAFSSFSIFTCECPLNVQCSMLNLVIECRSPNVRI